MSETTTPPPQDLETVISAESLFKANGEDSENLWVALYVTKFGKVCVFDVSSAKEFYAKGAAYAVFAARDASRALATMNLKETESNIDDLDDDKKKVLDDWATKYMSKYPIVGVLQQ